jgi:hypothetical protein
MSDDNPTTSNEASNAKQKHWAAWLLDIFVAIGAISQIGIGIVLIYQLGAYESSNKLTRQSLELNKQNLDLTAKNVALTQRSTELSQKTIELTQKNLELTQKNLDAAQEALKYSSKANEISEKGIETSNMPSLDVSISRVKASSFKKTDAIEIAYWIQNHSSSPAPRAFAQCFLEHATGCFDLAGISFDNNLAIMPHQTVSMTATLAAPPGNAKNIVNSINEGKVGIRIYVVLVSPVGKKDSFIETFYKSGRTFNVTNMKFNPSFSETDKMISESFGLNPKKN